MSGPPGFFSFDREVVFQALFDLMASAYAWKNTPQRRVKLWNEVPFEERPSFQQFEGDDEEWNWSNSANPTVVLNASLFIYTYAPKPQIGATILNNVLNAVTWKLTPTGRDLTTGRQTLGGLVHSARIQGSVTRVPGDIDDDGMAIVPIRILVNG